MGSLYLHCRGAVAERRLVSNSFWEAGWGSWAAQRRLRSQFGRHVIHDGVRVPPEYVCASAVLDSEQIGDDRPRRQTHDERHRHVPEHQRLTLADGGLVLQFGFSCDGRM